MIDKLDDLDSLDDLEQLEGLDRLEDWIKKKEMGCHLFFCGQSFNL